MIGRRRRWVALCTKKPAKKRIEASNCRHKAFSSAKYVSVKHKCPNFCRELCPRFVCFHTHSGLDRFIFYFLFLQYPLPDLLEGVDKAPHPAYLGVFDSLQMH